MKVLTAATIAAILLLAPSVAPAMTGVNSPTGPGSLTRAVQEARMKRQHAVPVLPAHCRDRLGHRVRCRHR
jgi:hypothetical protein